MSNTEDRNYRLTQKGQVTVPKAIRKHLGVSEGEAVRFEIEPDGDVVIRKSEEPHEIREREARMRLAFKEAGEKMDLRGMTPEEFVAWLRE